MRFNPPLTALAAFASSAQTRTSPYRRDAAAPPTPRAAPPNTLEGIYSGGRCVDVKDAQLQNGQPVQMWQCFGGANQQWQHSSGRLQTGLNQCLDVPDGRRQNGVRLQTWTCTPGNTNQAFEPVGQGLRWTGSNLCLDIVDGVMADGTPLQLWECDPANPNQAFHGLDEAPAVSTSRPTTPTPTTSAATKTVTTATASANDEADASPIVGSFLGFDLIELDDFVACHDELTAYAPLLQEAAVAADLPPILLGAIVLETSRGRADLLPGGLAGLDAPAIWPKYGQGGEIFMARDNLLAAGRYLAALLGQTDADLAAALAIYGADRPGFGDEVAQRMAGSI